ncbi:MAG: hypothetical protein KC492_40700, partial [Myxococcales bacterium]|nr:hypothetical protein [Myxococcales bacterium]
MPFLETLSPETLALGAAALFIVVAAILTSVLALAFAADRARLPLAVFRDGLEGEIATKEARRKELDQEILELQRTLAAGELAEAEAEHWRSLIEGVKAEWAGLAEQRQDIESVREEERKALEALGARQSAVSDAEARLDATEKRRKQLEEEINKVESKHGASLEEQDRRLREIEEQIGTRKGDLDEVRFELDQVEQALAAANDEVARAREEAERLRTEVEALSRDLTVKHASLARCEEALAAHEPLVREVDSLRDILADLQGQRDALQADAEFKEREVETLRRQEVRLSAAIADLEASRAALE